VASISGLHWGSNVFGQCSGPDDLENVVEISAGSIHVVALTADGKIFCWGGGHHGQCDVPSLAEPAIAVSGGLGISAAILCSGKVLCWGDDGNRRGLCTVPDVDVMMCGHILM
jgi:hypothetical protein